jgi:exosortase
MSTALATLRRSVAEARLPTLAVGAVSGALFWALWPTTLRIMAGRWQSDPQYTHGYLVPLFALYLLWERRELAARGPLSPSVFGLPLLLAGLGMHFLGLYIYSDFVAMLALLPCVAALFLLTGGWAALRWAWPAVAFLVFMIPLPYRVEVALAHPLQAVATACSTHLLQTLGFAAFAEGNIIRMSKMPPIGVAEACSGLSMLVIFFALCTALVLVIRRPLYQKIILIASAVPIAIAANVIRITVTGILYKTAGPRLADLVFHSLAGWLMMPLALGMLWLELRILSWVFVPVEPAKPRPLAGGGVRVPGLTTAPRAGLAPSKGGAKAASKKASASGVRPRQAQSRTIPAMVGRGRQFCTMPEQALGRRAPARKATPCAPSSCVRPSCWWWRTASWRGTGPTAGRAQPSWNGRRHACRRSRRTSATGTARTSKWTPRWSRLPRSTAT